MLPTRPHTCTEAERAWNECAQGPASTPAFQTPRPEHPLAPSRASPLRPAVWRSCRPLPGARKPEGVCRWVGGELSLLSDFKGRPTCLVLPGTLMARALRVPDPRKPLNPGRTRTVGHLNCFIRSLTDEFTTLGGSRGHPLLPGGSCALVPEPDRLAQTLTSPLSRCVASGTLVSQHLSGAGHSTCLTALS